MSYSYNIDEVTVSTIQLALKGGRALFDVLRLHRQLEQMNRDTLFKIFYFKNQANTFVLYWSVGSTCKEKQSDWQCTSLCLQEISQRSSPRPNKMVYDELGRHLCCYIRAINYWFSLLKMDSERLQNQAYRMLTNLDSNGKCNWASSITSVLQSLGFGYVWLAQGVERGEKFCVCLSNDLQMCSGRTGWLVVTAFPSIAITRSNFRY